MDDTEYCWKATLIAATVYPSRLSSISGAKEWLLDYRHYVRHRVSTFLNCSNRETIISWYCSEELILLLYFRKITFFLDMMGTLR